VEGGRRNRRGGSFAHYLGIFLSFPIACPLYILLIYPNQLQLAASVPYWRSHQRHNVGFRTPNLRRMDFRESSSTRKDKLRSDF
jgi:hypothetical protein